MWNYIVMWGAGSQKDLSFHCERQQNGGYIFGDLKLLQNDSVWYQNLSCSICKIENMIQLFDSHLVRWTGSKPLNGWMLLEHSWIKMENVSLRPPIVQKWGQHIFNGHASNNAFQLECWMNTWTNLCQCQNNLKHLWGVVWVFGLAYVLPETMEEEGFLTASAAHRHFCGAVMSSIFLYIWDLVIFNLPV